MGYSKGFEMQFNMNHPGFMSDLLVKIVDNKWIVFDINDNQVTDGYFYNETLDEIKQWAYYCISKKLGW